MVNNRPRQQHGFSALYVLIALSAVMVLVIVGYFVRQTQKPVETNFTTSTTQIDSFEDCKNAGNPIMESYPEQCSANGKTFSNTNQAVDVPAEAISASQTDNKQIAEAIKEDCLKNGATDGQTVVTIVTNNMQDANLYKKDTNFARISASCAAESGGFRVFLQKKDGDWEILGKSQVDTLGCKVLDGISIPASVATTCYEEGGVERAIQ